MGGLLAVASNAPPLGLFLPEERLGVVEAPKMAAEEEEEDPAALELEMEMTGEPGGACC